MVTCVCVCVCVCVCECLPIPHTKKEGLRSERQAAKKNKKKTLTTREAGSYIVFRVEGLKGFTVQGLGFRPKFCTCPKKEQRAFEGRC